MMTIEEMTRDARLAKADMLIHETQALADRLMQDIPDRLIQDGKAVKAMAAAERLVKSKVQLEKAVAEIEKLV